MWFEAGQTQGSFYYFSPSLILSPFPITHFPPSWTHIHTNKMVNLRNRWPVHGSLIPFRWPSLSFLPLFCLHYFPFPFFCSLDIRPNSWYKPIASVCSQHKLWPLTREMAMSSRSESWVEMSQIHQNLVDQRQDVDREGEEIRDWGMYYFFWLVSLLPDCWSFHLQLLLLPLSFSIERKKNKIQDLNPHSFLNLNWTASFCLLHRVLTCVSKEGREDDHQIPRIVGIEGTFLPFLLLLASTTSICRFCFFFKLWIDWNGGSDKKKEKRISFQLFFPFITLSISSPLFLFLPTEWWQNSLFSEVSK